MPFRYQGQYEDIETGLYYNRFRYYSSDTGSYLSKDPIGLEGGMQNLYSYINNSLILIDVFGLSGGTSTVFTSSDGLTLQVKNIQDLSHLSDKELTKIDHANNIILKGLENLLLMLK